MQDIISISRLLALQRLRPRLGMDEFTAISNSKCLIVSGGGGTKVVKMYNNIFLQIKRTCYPCQLADQVSAFNHNIVKTACVWLAGFIRFFSEHSITTAVELIWKIAGDLFFKTVLEGSFFPRHGLRVETHCPIRIRYHSQASSLVSFLAIALISL